MYNIYKLPGLKETFLTISLLTRKKKKLSYFFLQFYVVLDQTLKHCMLLLILEDVNNKNMKCGMKIECLQSVFHVLLVLLDFNQKFVIVVRFTLLLTLNVFSAQKKLFQNRTIYSLVCPADRA